ncbi:MAG: LysR family transcriptional regulator [Thauera sp.]|nr:LysR family transcriptional regulator [Thauera sp.]
MNLNLLRIYVAVVEAQGFSRAAEALDISQPAASKAVKELETQLDTVLLERQGRSFQLSEPGRMLFDYGRSIFALEREADEVIRSFGALDRGQLTIGASTTIATYWLPPYLARFHERYPGISLRLVSANTAHITEQLLECGIDVALVEGPVADARFETRAWREDEMVVIVSREHPLPDDDVIAPAALAEHLWVVRERGSGSREATDSILAGLGIAAPQTIEVGSNEAIVQTVAAGAGLGLVPRICARDQLALGRVRRVLPQKGPLLRQLYRMRLPQRPVSHAALAFEALLLEPVTGR